MVDREIPEDMDEYISRALKMISDQAKNPHIYDNNTQEALDRISAFAARFKIESAWCSLNGERTKATFYNKHCDALEIMINSLKYKIKTIPSIYKGAD